MLTKEQFNNLKKDAPPVIHTTYDHTDSDGDIWYRSPGVHAISNTNFIAPTCVSLPTDSQSSTVNSQSKYDPTRLFKKGDMVRVVKCKERDFNSWARSVKDQLLVVDVDEMLDCDISVIAENGEENSIDPAYLELITPVEELEPYYVERQGVNEGGLCYTVRKNGGWVESTFYFGKGRSRDEQQAKAAAEAEAARLNDEWRKNQNHD